jgi:class 3 adenylate cyclase
MTRRSYSTLGRDSCFPGSRDSDRIRQKGRLPLQSRVGVNTGDVVVRSITNGAGQVEYTPIGHTTNLASRIQVVAPIGSIAATEQVRKLCEGYFILKPRNVSTKLRQLGSAISGASDLQGGRRQRVDPDRWRRSEDLFGHGRNVRDAP